MFLEFDRVIDLQFESLKSQLYAANFCMIVNLKIDIEKPFSPWQKRELIRFCQKYLNEDNQSESFQNI